MAKHPPMDDGQFVYEICDRAYIAYCYTRKVYMFDDFLWGVHDRLLEASAPDLSTFASLVEKYGTLPWPLSDRFNYK